MDLKLYIKTIAVRKLPFIWQKILKNAAIWYTYIDQFVVQNCFTKLYHFLNKNYSISRHTCYGVFRFWRNFWKHARIEAFWFIFWKNSEKNSYIHIEITHAGSWACSPKKFWYDWCNLVLFYEDFVQILS